MNSGICATFSDGFPFWEILLSGVFAVLGAGLAAWVALHLQKRDWDRRHKEGEAAFRRQVEWRAQERKMEWINEALDLIGAIKAEAINRVVEFPSRKRALVKAEMLREKMKAERADDAIGMAQAVIDFIEAEMAIRTRWDSSQLSNISSQKWEWVNGQALALADDIAMWGRGDKEDEFWSSRDRILPAGFKPSPPT